MNVTSVPPTSNLTLIGQLGSSSLKASKVVLESKLLPTLKDKLETVGQGKLFPPSLFTPSSHHSPHRYPCTSQLIHSSPSPHPSPHPSSPASLHAFSFTAPSSIRPFYSPFPSPVSIPLCFFLIILQKSHRRQRVKCHIF